MFRLKWLLVLVWIFMAVQPSFADDRDKILGTWRVVSWENEWQATGEREQVYGKNPTGYLIFTPEGRFMCVLTGEGRTAPKTDEDRAALLKSVVAYTGMYRLEGDKWMLPGTPHGLALNRDALSRSMETGSKHSRPGYNR
jgi:hypothetical protein